MIVLRWCLPGDSRRELLGRRVGCGNGVRKLTPFRPKMNEAVPANGVRAINLWTKSSMNLTIPSRVFLR
jgi:hypothetical protein